MDDDDELQFYVMELSSLLTAAQSSQHPVFRGSLRVSNVTIEKKEREGGGVLVSICSATRCLLHHSIDWSIRTGGEVGSVLCIPCHDRQHAVLYQ
jgi:hypothetical protein